MEYGKGPDGGKCLDPWEEAFHCIDPQSKAHDLGRIRKPIIRYGSRTRTSRSRAGCCNTSCRCPQQQGQVKQRMLWLGRSGVPQMGPDHEADGAPTDGVLPRIPEARPNQGDRGPAKVLTVEIGTPESPRLSKRDLHPRHRPSSDHLTVGAEV